MEESCEMHSEDDKALSDKNKKRTVKTRSQIEALEKFYNEHKYPTESLKLEVAKRIGLTEKQISSWFCHRRLKDKKLFQGETYTNGRQDRSSGVIQDLGSGLRQDSCGSTKQGDEKYHDPREVESRRLAGQDLSAADLTYEHGSHYVRNYSRMDDTSSGSNSSLRNMYFKGDPVDMATSKYATQNLSINVKGGKARSGPSGYLKVKGHVENAAITAVKRQLGRHYREDGPPLGIEFDPLPPGAFESSGQDPVSDIDKPDIANSYLFQMFTMSEPYYVGEHAQHHSPDVPEIHQEHLSKLYHVEEHNLPHSADVSKIRKQPISGTGYGYISKMSSHNADLDGEKYKITHGSDHSEKLFRQKSEQKLSFSKHRSIDVHEGSAREIAISDSRVRHEMRAINGVGGFRTDSVVGHHNIQPYGGEGNLEQAGPWLHNNNDKVRRVAQGDRFRSNSSDLNIKGRKYNVLEDERLFRKMAKVDKIYGARRIIDDNRDEVQVNILSKNEMQRVKDGFSDQEYAGKASQEEVPQWTNHQLKRPATEMPSSFSEDDETADTNSSVD